LLMLWVWLGRPWVGGGGGVSKRAQELFLEMAHHFPERGAPYLVTRMAQVWNPGPRGLTSKVSTDGMCGVGQ
jgi:hypothetical protein